MSKTRHQSKTSSRTVKPATDNQALAMEYFASKPVTVIEGIAGTGKTYIAVGYALGQFLTNKISRIILTRPLINVGNENIGFLPGEVENKIAPYADQFNEYMNEFMPSLAFSDEKRVQHGVEFIPLAFIRGRNFANSIIIADEMQNSSPLQMKTLLSRAAENTTIIILGDSKQSDKPSKDKSGLDDLVERVKLSHSASFGVVTMTKHDILRSGLVREVLELYGDI